MKKPYCIVIVNEMGHSVAYARLYGRLFSKAGLHVVVAGPPSFIEACQLTGEFGLTPTPPFKDKNRLQWIPFRRLREILNVFFPWAIVVRTALYVIIVQKSLPRFVFLPHLDPLITHMAGGRLAAVYQCFRFIPWYGLIMKPRRLKRLLEMRGVKGGSRLPGCRGMISLDETEDFQFLSSRIPTATFPDVTDCSITASDFRVAREMTAFAKGRRILLLAGAIAERKGVSQFLRMVDQLPQTWCGAIVGRVEWDTFDQSKITKAKLLKLQQQTSDRIYTHFHWTTEGELNAAVKMSNVIFAAYPNFIGSSNLLTKAAILSKPVVVAASARLLVKRVTDYRLGIVVGEELTDDDWLFFQEPDEWLEKKGGAQFDQYAADHSIELLEKKLREFLHEHFLGKPLREPHS